MMLALRALLTVLAVNWACLLQPVTSDEEAYMDLPSVSDVLEDIIRYLDDPLSANSPTLRLPDPMFFPECQQLTSKLSIWGQKIYGFSALRVEHLVVNLTQFSGCLHVSLPTLTAIGQYEWKATFSWNDAVGSTNVTFQDVDLILRVKLKMDERGTLILKHESTKLDMDYRQMDFDFENLSSTYLFSLRAMVPAALPSLLSWVKSWLLADVNVYLQNSLAQWRFPEPIPRLDYLFTKAEHHIKDRELDPWVIRNVDVSVGLGFKVRLPEILFTGLSSLHRTGDVYLRFHGDQVCAFIEVGAQDLIATGALMGWAFEGKMDRMSCRVEAHMKIDLLSPPLLRDLHCQLGHIDFRSAGLGSVDYLAEAIGNLLPNLIRDTLSDAVENQLWHIIQEDLFMMNIRGFIIDQLKQLR